MSGKFARLNGLAQLVLIGVGVDGGLRGILRLPLGVVVLLLGTRHSDHSTVLWSDSLSLGCDAVLVSNAKISALGTGSLHKCVGTAADEEGIAGRTSIEATILC